MPETALTPAEARGPRRDGRGDGHWAMR
jgi:hypothetical protein